MNTELSIRFINAKYSTTTRDELIALRKDIGKEIQDIKRAKDQVFIDYPGVHGRFQHSQLDVLDIREQKACGMFDQVNAMI